MGGCTSKEHQAQGEAPPAAPARQSPVSPPREGHGPPGRSVPPRRGCLSQRPPTVTRVEEERGDLGAGRGGGSTAGGLHSSRDTWDVLGAPGIRAWPGSLRWIIQAGGRRGERPPGGQRAGGSGEDAPDAGCQDDGEDDTAQHDQDLLLLGETGTVRQGHGWGGGQGKGMGWGEGRGIRMGLGRGTRNGEGDNKDRGCAGWRKDR